MATVTSYEPRYFAYIDILGFQGLISQLKSGAIPFTKLRNILHQIHAPPKLSPNPYPESDFRAQSISDAVALSSAVNADGLLHLFDAIQSMAEGLLFEGFFIRGAIVKGNLFQDDHMVFGEALVDAYLLERDIVRYPRVMVVQSVLGDVRNYAKQHVEPFKDTLLQADDGPMYLNILRRASYEMELKLSVDTEIDYQSDDTLLYYGNMRDRIAARFSESIDNPRHFEKVQWFAKYWNKQIPSGRGMRPIQGPGLQPEPAVWG